MRNKTVMLLAAIIMMLCPAVSFAQDGGAVCDTISWADMEFMPVIGYEPYPEGTGTSRYQYSIVVLSQCYLASFLISIGIVFVICTTCIVLGVLIAVYVFARLDKIRDDLEVKT